MADGRRRSSGGRSSQFFHYKIPLSCKTFRPFPVLKYFSRFMAKARLGYLSR
jgi:hypothetical protein